MSTILYIFLLNIVVEKIRAELASLNHCAVPFLSRAAVNFCWYLNTSFLSFSVSWSDSVLSSSILLFLSPSLSSLLNQVYCVYCKNCLWFSVRLSLQKAIVKSWRRDVGTVGERESSCWIEKHRNFTFTL